MVNTPVFNTKEQFTLRVQKELSVQLDEIIQKIQQIAQTFSIEKDKEKSAFKNVLNVAMDSSASLEAIKIFIRYQVGRQGASRIWINNPDFANALVQQIDELSNDVEAILSRIKQNCGESHTVTQHIANNQIPIQRSLHLQLVQLYLGYLSREHTARLGANFQNNDSPKDDHSEHKPKPSQEPQRHSPKSNKPKRNR